MAHAHHASQQPARRPRPADAAPRSMAYADATSDALDHERSHEVAVKWPELFRTLESARHKREWRIVRERRLTFHPSCHGYAMLPDDALQQKVLDDALQQMALNDALQ